MELLISLLIFCIIAALVWWALSAIPLPEPFKTIILVLFVLIMVIVLLSYLPIGPFHLVR